MNVVVQDKGLNECPIEISDDDDESHSVSRCVVHCNDIITKRDSTRYEMLVILEVRCASVKGSELSY